MEKKFKELSNLSKAHKNHETTASKTFEFDLFQSSSWFLSMNDWDKKLISTETKTEQIVDLKNQVASVPTPSLNPEAKLKVLFIGDTYNGEGEDLLAKMIVAMKLSNSEFYRLPLDTLLEEITDLENNLSNPNEVFLNLINEIETRAPLFVISLGALVTNLLLGRREKMSSIHGKYLKTFANHWEYQLMPIFHPDFLLINPNMKRTAWMDLQKVMESLGKN